MDDGVMKFWLIIFFFTPGNGEFVRQKEIAYKNEARCLAAQDKVKPPHHSFIVRTFCVSDNHHSGRAKDPNVEYD